MQNINVYLKEKSWCLKQGIKIYIVPIQYSKECFIEINDNGKIIKSPVKYKTQKIASQKIWDLYLYLYNLSNGNEKN